jgi:hypothetical protein
MESEAREPLVDGSRIVRVLNRLAGSYFDAAAMPADRMLSQYRLPAIVP